MPFLKLSETTNFTVSSISAPVWKFWDGTQMRTSQKYEQGFKKYYPVTTPSGQLDLSPNNMGQMLMAVLGNKTTGIADLNGAIFDVVQKPQTLPDGSPKMFNGKQVNNYFFNFKGYGEEVFQEEPVDPSEIPF